RNFWLVLLVFGLVSPLAAQGLNDDPRASDLRRQIEERFTARVKEELALTDQQTTRMKSTVRDWFLKRRDMEDENRQLRDAMAGQLRPGVAANKDSVAKLTDGMLDLKVRYAQSFKDEIKEMSGYLDPVQRAQFMVLRERLLERVREVREQRDDSTGRLRRRQQP
ncbi:MAG TPA: Spy/CpxP family protein refolding chaperone, partial [Gemmatimonadales bacterium]|nr:Spy/CpxP family protein refolding chaperone [Gemmatimonadales bacterium]